jgi:orotidine-5'-phosphate decarboxylase
MQSLLIQKINSRAHPVCIGFDPDISQLHPFLQRQLDKTTPEVCLTRWYESVINACASEGHSIKFQSAFFEQFGGAGFALLKDMIADAKRRGLFVILDAKRGDISTTMAAYGRAAFKHLGADALTVLPWMGTDSLECLVEWMRQGKGVYIVWLSSNASGRRIQCKPTREGSSIAAVVFDDFYAVANAHGVGAQIGWVLGATDLESEAIGSLDGRPHSLLCPGIGAQGAMFNQQIKSLTDAHPATLFPISRGLIQPLPDETLTTWTDYQNNVRKRWQSFITAWSSL